MDSPPEVRVSRSFPHLVPLFRFLFSMWYVVSSFPVAVLVVPGNRSLSPRKEAFSISFKQVKASSRRVSPFVSH